MNPGAIPSTLGAWSTVGAAAPVVVEDFYLGAAGAIIAPCHDDDTSPPGIDEGRPRSHRHWGPRAFEAPAP